MTNKYILFYSSNIAYRFDGVAMCSYTMSRSQLIYAYTAPENRLQRGKIGRGSLMTSLIKREVINYSNWMGHTPVFCPLVTAVTTPSGRGVCVRVCVCVCVWVCVCVTPIVY